MGTNVTPGKESRAHRRDYAVAGACAAFVALMVGAAYAAVPL
jgi:cytochrome c oxidase assembly protein Cox11